VGQFFPNILDVPVTATKSQTSFKEEKDINLDLKLPYPNISINDIIGASQCKKVLEEAILWPIKYPELFKKRKTWSSILLFGVRQAKKSISSQTSYS